MGGRCSSAAPGLCMSVERFGCVFIFSHNFHTRFSIVCVSSFAERDFLCHIHSGSDILCFLLFKRSSRSCGRRHSITQSLWQAPSAKPAGSPTDSLRFAFAIQSTNPLFHSLQTGWVSDPIHQRVCGSDVWKKMLSQKCSWAFSSRDSDCRLCGAGTWCAFWNYTRWLGRARGHFRGRGWRSIWWWCWSLAGSCSGIVAACSTTPLLGDDVGSHWWSRQPRAGGGHYVSSPSPHSGCTGQRVAGKTLTLVLFSSFDAQ